MKKIILMLLLSTSLCAQKHEFYISRSVSVYSFELKEYLDIIKKIDCYVNIKVEAIFDEVKIKCNTAKDFLVMYDELVIVDY